MLYKEIIDIWDIKTWLGKGHNINITPDDYYDTDNTLSLNIIKANSFDEYVKKLQFELTMLNKKIELLEDSTTINKENIYEDIEFITNKIINISEDVDTISKKSEYMELMLKEQTQSLSDITIKLNYFYLDKEFNDFNEL